MSKQLVLVTGATGHLGFRTLVLTLQHGFKARVALRKLEQAEKLKATTSLKPFVDNDVEFVAVPDITADGAYDEAIKDVDHVIHVASPIYSGFSADEKDWKRMLYDPAEKGVLSMLSAAAKEPKVKRVVVTSSVGVLERKNGADHVGPYDLKDVPSQETLESAPDARLAYVFSKILSYAAATAFAKEHNVHYDLIQVLPGYIQGANELYTSAATMRDAMTLGSNEGTMLTALGTVPEDDVRATSQVFLDDVAKAHVVALTAAGVRDGTNLVVQADGGRAASWAEIAEMIRRLYPEEVEKGVLKPGTQGTEWKMDFDVRESEEVLGFRSAGHETYVRSVVGQYLELLGREGMK